MSYVALYQDKTVTAKAGTVNIRKLPGTSAASTVLATLTAGNVLQSTGQVTHQPDGNWVQVMLIFKKTFGYIREDLIKIVEVDPKDLVGSLVAYDKLVFESLLRSSVYLAGLQQAGKNIDKEKEKYKALYNRLTQRQNALKTSTLVKCQSGIDSAYQSMTGYVKGLFGISGIGEPVSITIIIGITVVAAAALTVLVIQAFKPAYDASKADLQVSKDFEDLLKTTTPEKARAIVDDLTKQKKDAYNDGKSDATGLFGDLGSTLKYGAVALLFFMGINAIKKNSK